MSFSSLKNEELMEVAEYFAKDVVLGNPEKGPTKKELLAALAVDDGQGPVTWENYTNIFLPNRVVTNPVQTEAGNPLAEPTVITSEAVSGEPVVASQVNTAPVVITPATVVTEPEITYILLKMERKNPRYDVAGYSFTTDHPFQKVESKVAEYIILNVDGFRQALPSEVQSYYN